MKSKGLDYLIIITMVLCGLYVALTGLVMDVLNRVQLLSFTAASSSVDVIRQVHKLEVAPGLYVSGKGSCVVAVPVHEFYYERIR